KRGPSIPKRGLSRLSDSAGLMIARSPLSRGRQLETLRQYLTPASAGANGANIFAADKLLLHPRRRDHAPPFRGLAVDVVGELLRRAAQYVDALLLQRLDHVAGLERLVGGARELLDDVGRRAGRCHQPAPYTGVEALEARFFHGGQIRRDARPLE